MKVRLTFVVCFVSLLGGVPQVKAQFDLYIAHVADGAGWFSEITVNNPGSSTVACMFSTFDDQGNPLGLGYGSNPAAPTAHAHPLAKAATSLAVDSVSLFIQPGSTATLDTSGEGDGSANPLQGAAVLNCSAFVIGGVTYWLTSGKDLITGIGVPAANTTTAFQVIGGNASTAFAIYNPSQANILSLSVEAIDGATGNLDSSINIEIPANGHYAFNAINELPSLSPDFAGSFSLSASGQQFVPLALGVADTSTNPAGFLLFAMAGFSGQIP